MALFGLETKEMNVNLNQEIGNLSNKKIQRRFRENLGYSFDVHPIDLYTKLRRRIFFGIKYYIIEYKSHKIYPNERNMYDVTS